MRAQDYALGCYVDGISEVLVVRQWVPNLISLKLFSLLVSTYLLAAVVCVCVCVCLGQIHSLCILVRLTPCVFRSDLLPVCFGQTQSLYLFVILAPRVFGSDLLLVSLGQTWSDSLPVSLGQNTPTSDSILNLC